MAKYVNYAPARALGEFRILPGYIGETSVGSVSLSSPVTAYKRGKPLITLNAAIISSPMQAIYSPELNIELAKIGAFSISNWSQPVEEQARKRREVKSKKGGFVTPDVVGPDMTIGDLEELTKRTSYNTFPVTSDGTLETPMVGIITSNDYYPSHHRSMLVRDRMTPIEKVSLGLYDEIGDDLHKANTVLIESRHGHLPIVDKDGRIVYMVFKKDIDEHLKHPNATVDGSKRYMGGDAINTVDYAERVPVLVDAGTSMLYIATSQAYSAYVAKTLKFVRDNYPDMPVGAGNVVTEDGFVHLAKNGAACVGVGMGPGSICITQDQIGVGRAQGTAIVRVARARDRYFRETGTYVPIIADGGISTPAHATVALALGADAIMGGRIFAGTDESPNPTNGENNAKLYWGEGSRRAREWMDMRYGHVMFQEGVEGWVPKQGPAGEHMEKFGYAIRDGLRKGGCMSIPEAHVNAMLEINSENATMEGHPHDIRL